MAGSTLVKELQYWFNKFIITTNLNRDFIPTPAEIPDYIVNNNDEDNSFLRLLFDDSWNKTNYNYYFLKNIDKQTWPYLIRDRLGIYPMNSQYYESTTDSTSGINFFILQNDDFLLLDSLLIYRNNPLNFTITDSTSNILIGFDLQVNFDLLSTELSKLIYVYLMLKKNSDFSKYENLPGIISSSNNILNTLYEKYVIENLFSVVSGS